MRPTLSRLAVGSVAAVALSLSAAAPGLADDGASTPSASETAAAAEVLAPADPTAPVEATTTVDTSATATESTAATESPAAVTSPSATASPTTGGNGAYSYPFILTTGEGSVATVAIEVAGTGVSVGYTVDEQGKVTDAVVAAGAATLVKSTPHTIFLVLETGETVKVKVHGDSVRVKVKPVRGGPLRPGISTPEEIAADEAAEIAEETEASEAEEADAAKPAKVKKEKKEKKTKKEKKAKKPNRAKS